MEGAVKDTGRIRRNFIVALMAGESECLSWGTGIASYGEKVERKNENLVG